MSFPNSSYITHHSSLLFLPLCLGVFVLNSRLFFPFSIFCGEVTFRGSVGKDKERANLFLVLLQPQPLLNLS